MPAREGYSADLEGSGQAGQGRVPAPAGGRQSRRAGLSFGGLMGRMAVGSAALMSVVALVGPGAAAVASDGGLRAAAEGREVANEAELRRAWTDPRRRRIDLAADIFLRDCQTGDMIRESPYPLLDGTRTVKADTPRSGRGS